MSYTGYNNRSTMLVLMLLLLPSRITAATEYILIDDVSLYYNDFSVHEASLNFKTPVEPYAPTSSTWRVKIRLTNAAEEETDKRVVEWKYEDEKFKVQFASCLPYSENKVLSLTLAEYKAKNDKVWKMTRVGMSIIISLDDKVVFTQLVESQPCKIYFDTLVLKYFLLDSFSQHIEYEFSGTRCTPDKSDADVYRFDPAVPFAMKSKVACADSSYMFTGDEELYCIDGNTRKIGGYGANYTCTKAGVEDLARVMFYKHEPLDIQLTYWGELKVQNFFVTETRNVEVNPSAAICMLEDVESLKTETNSNKKEFILILLADDVEKCKITIKTNGVYLNDGSEEIDMIVPGKDANAQDCTGNDNPYKYKYMKTDEEKQVIRLYVEDSEVNQPLKCKLSSKDTSSSNPETVDIRVIDKNEVALYMTPEKVEIGDKDVYLVKSKVFKCKFHGASNIESVKMGLTGDDKADERSTESTINLSHMDTTSVECSATISDSNKDIIEQVNLILSRTYKLYNCEEGFQLNQGSCEACDKGKYKSGTEMNTCQGCGENQYASNVGSITCIDCSGKVTGSKSKCEPCQPGSRYETESNTCEQCDPGSYHYENDTVDMCIACEKHKYSPKEGAVECYDCIRGVVNKKRTECAPCEAGSRYDKTEGKCVLCYAGSYHDTMTDTCVQCKGKDYSTTNGTTYCYTCDGTVSGDPKLNNTICTPVQPEPKPEPVKSCLTDEIVVNMTESIGTITFAAVEQAGGISRAKCPNNNDAEATYECSASGDWINFDISQCRSDKTKTLEEIELSEDTVDTIIDNTKDPKKIAPIDVRIVAEKVVEDSGKLIKDSTNQTEAIEQCLSVTSNLMAASVEVGTNQETKNKVIKSTETIVGSYLKEGSSQDKLVIETDMVKTVVIPNVGASTVEDNLIKQVLSINIPEDSNIKNIGISVYENSSLFSSKSNTSRESITILGKVVGLKHTKPDGVDTDEKVNFELVFTSNSVKDTDNNHDKRKECKWYDADANTWESSGCTTKITSDGDVICNCEHMTSFAVILSVAPNYTVTWLGDLVLAINIFFCLLTLLCTIPFRTFRVRKMTVIQSHSIWVLLLLCIMWYLTYLDFGENASEHNGCKVVTFILHYLLISYFSWTFCCTLTLKNQILDAVKSFGKKNKNLVKNSCMFAYGFPLVFPTFGVLFSWITKEFYRDEMEAAGGKLNYIRETEVCWYSDLWLMLLVLFPVYVFLLINTFYFIKLLRVVSNARRGGDNSKLAKAFFALLVTQGLPWFIQPGILTGKTGAMVFQYLFLITFGLQGIGIFLCNVVCQEEVFKNLCSILKVKPPRWLLTAPPKRHSPATGDTSMVQTSRNSTNSDNKTYSNNLTIGSIGISGVETISKNLYEDPTYELYENSIASDDREHTYNTLGSKRSLNSACKKIDEAFTAKEGTFKIKFVGNNRVYAIDGDARPSTSTSSYHEEPPKSPADSEHQGPPFL